MINTTVDAPKVNIQTLIGLNVPKAIHPLDRPGYEAALKHVTTNKTHEYVAYRVGPHPFISLMVAYHDIIVVAELPDEDPNAREQQKDILMSSVKGLLNQPVTA